MGKQWKQCQTLFFWAPKSLQMVIAAMKLKDAYSLEWRRKWQPTPVFLPGESHRQKSLVGYSPWGHKESDTTEWLHFFSLSLLGNVANLDSTFKNRDITLPKKVRLVKAMIFPVVMYGCESWTVKKAEHPRIDAFELWCGRRLLRVPWTQGDPTSPF